MSWTFSIWVAAALMALSRGQNIGYEGNSLSPSGYHLCIHNETRIVSYLVMHKAPYTVTNICGGWLLWKTCEVTVYKMVPQTEHKTVAELVTKCCDGYVQVGRYCALPVNRTGELLAKPGSCPTADVLCPIAEDCVWDMDCPGWQKCCQRLGLSFCSQPSSSANHSVNGGYRWNATVTVKTDHQQLLSQDKGLLNHTRLLHAMVTGALQPDEVSVRYLSSWPVHPYRTATSLLIVCSSTLSLHSVTSKLHLLLKHIQEVTSVTVEDVDECVQSTLHQCSPQAQCNNTVGSYLCTCHQGYIDVEPSNPGANCTAGVGMWTSTETPLTHLSPMTTTYTPAPNTTQEPPDSSTTVTHNSSEISMTTALSYTSSVPYNSSHALQWMSSAPYISKNSTEELPLPTSTCSPPSITTLTLFNVTGTSLCVFWSSQFQTNQTYRVVLRKGSEVIHPLETHQTMMEVRGLQPGGLYNITVTPRACGREGVSQHVLAKTDAQTLDATTRLTNINFTDDLHNSSSQAYKNLTASIIEEIYQSLSEEMKLLVRIEIRSFSAGSVVVNFVLTLILTPSQSQDINNVSLALLNSLMNSSKYTVDRNSTSITDFNECESGENDCSQWATCKNTNGSYTCVCKEAFTDNNPDRPGRACQANASSETITPSPIPAILSTAGTAPLSLTTARDPTLTTVTTTPNITTVIISTSEMVSSTATSTTAGSTTSTVITVATLAATTPAMTTTTNPPTTTTAAPTTMATASTTMTTALTTTTTAPVATATAATTTNSAPITMTTSPITTSTAPTTMTTGPTAMATAATTTTTALTTTTTATTVITTNSTTTNSPPTTTTTAPTTTTTAPTTTTTAPITMTTAPTTITTAQTTITTAPITMTTAPTTITAAPITMTTAPTTIATAPTTTTTAPITMTTAPTTITTAPITMTTAPTTITTAPITMTTAPTPITTAPITMTTAPTTITTAPTTITTAPTTINTTKTSITSTPAATVTNTTAAAATTTALAQRTHSVQGAISVQCRVTSITVTVSREFLLTTKINESALYLGLQECGVNGGNATHAQLTVAWNECATILTHNETHYTVSVTLFNSMDPNIPPRVRLEVPIMCPYMKSMLISADFGSMGYDIINDIIMGLGSFQVTVRLMNGTVPLPHNYSLSSEDSVVVEVSLNTSSEQIKVVINKCWATPTLNPADTQSYPFIENSCSLNTYTDVLMNGNYSTSRVSVQIFSFVNLDVIYLHCQVYICVQRGSDTCVPDCLQRTSRSMNRLGTSHGSTGPLQRLFDYNLDQEFDTVHIIGFSCLGVGLMVFFLFGFVCLFYYQRNRIGHYNFSVKPKPENFTYLVFNT